MEQNLDLKRLEKNHKQFKDRIKVYISKYGDRCSGGELKIETVNYKENPTGFISLSWSTRNSLV